MWTEAKKNYFILEKQDGYARIYPNISSYGNVVEWQSDCYRLPIACIRIEGRSIKSAYLEECKRFLEGELKFLLSINVPERTEI